MISETLFIALLIAAALLAAYAILCESPVPFADLVCIIASDVIMWSASVLYASGNVCTQEYVLQTTTLTDNITTYTWQLIQTPSVDIVIASLLLAGAASLTLYTLYLLIPAVMSLLTDDEVSNV